MKPKEKSISQKVQSSVNYQNMYHNKVTSGQYWIDLTNYRFNTYSTQASLQIPSDHAQILESISLSTQSICAPTGFSPIHVASFFWKGVDFYF